MVLEMRDEAGVLLNDPSAQDGEGRNPQGTKRFIKVSLDPAQFAIDRRDGNEVYQVTLLQTTCVVDILNLLPILGQIYS
jgi:hypothetical protein